MLVPVDRLSLWISESTGGEQRVCDPRGSIIRWLLSWELQIPDDKEGRHKVDPTLKHSHSFRMNGKRLEIKMNVSPNHDPDTWLRNAPIVVIGLVKEVVGLDIEVQLCRIP